MQYNWAETIHNIIYNGDKQTDRKMKQKKTYVCAHMHMCVCVRACV